MDGWSDYLTYSALNLMHLCVVGISGRRWAQSNSDRFVKTREACVIDDLMTTRSIVPRNKGKSKRSHTDSVITTPFYVAGVSYVIDDSEDSFYATSTKSPAYQPTTNDLELLRASRQDDSGSNQNEVVIASRTNNFVIIGVCVKSREQLCIDVIKEIVHYLREEKIEDLQENEGIYGRIAHMKRSVNKRVSGHKHDVR